MRTLTLLDGTQATDVDVAGLGIANASSMVVTDDGHTLIADGQGDLTAVTPDGTVAPVDTERQVVALATDGERLWARSWDDRGPLLDSEALVRTM